MTTVSPAYGTEGDDSCSCKPAGGDGGLLDMSKHWPEMSRCSSSYSTCSTCSDAAVSSLRLSRSYGATFSITSHGSGVSTVIVSTARVCR